MSIFILLLTAILLATLITPLKDQNTLNSSNDLYADWVASGEFINVKVNYADGDHLAEYELTPEKPFLLIDNRKNIQNPNYKVSYILEHEPGQFIDVELNFNFTVAFINGIEPGSNVISNFGDSETFISVPTDWTGKTELPIYLDKFTENRNLCLSVKENLELCHYYAKPKEEEVRS